MKIKLQGTHLNHHFNLLNGKILAITQIGIF